MEHEVDRQIRTSSAGMFALYLSVIMKRELSLKMKLSMY